MKVVVQYLGLGGLVKLGIAKREITVVVSEMETALRAQSGGGGALRSERKDRVQLECQNEAAGNLERVARALSKDWKECDLCSNVSSKD